MRKLVNELTIESKEVLNLVAGETAVMLLNKKAMKEKFALNELCFVPDLLLAKNPNSLIDSLARIRDTKDHRTYSLTLLNKSIITRHVSQIVSTKANFNTTNFQNIDPQPDFHKKLTLRYWVFEIVPKIIEF